MPNGRAAHDTATSCSISRTICAFDSCRGDPNTDLCGSAKSPYGPNRNERRRPPASDRHRPLSARRSGAAIQLDLRTAKRWAQGYQFKRGGQTHASPGVMPLALPSSGKEVDVTFAEMLTLRLVKGFRSAGLRLQTIKLVAQKASADFNVPTPFISRKFRTDGRKVFLELREFSAANDEAELQPSERKLIEVLTGQQAFAEVVEPSLFADVEWTDDLASKWWPLGQNRCVVLDPAVLFGAPRLAETRVPTAPVAAAVRAEGGGDTAVAAVAEWFGLSTEAVRDAVKFETEWLARAA